MPALKARTSEPSTLLFAVLAMAGSTAFLVIAGFSGFRIPIILFALPIAAHFGALAPLTFLVKHVATRKLLQLHQLLLGIVAIVAGSGVLRLIVAFYASYYPDEYGSWAILKTQPWLHMPDFLRSYHQLAGPQIVHPPLAFLLMSLGYAILPSLEGARVVSVILALASIPVVYWLASLLMDYRTALLTSAIFAFLPHTIVFLSLALTDTYVFFFGLLAVAAFVSSIRRGAKYHLLASGLFLGLAFWSKATVPLLWSFAILLLALFLRWMTRTKTVAWATACNLVGIIVYAAWGFISPSAFRVSTDLSIRILTFERINLGSFPASVFPSLPDATQSTISFVDLLLQLPAWFTPLVIIFSLLGVYRVLIKRERQATWIVLLAIVPLLAMIPYYRDIRYLLISSVPIGMLAITGFGCPRFRRDQLSSVVLIFLVVGSISIIPIVQQQYAGIREASEVLTDLGLSNRVILTNAMSIQNFLVNARVVYLHPYRIDSVQRLLNSENVGAVVIMHQRRGVWVTPAPDLMTLLQSHFRNRIAGGPSDFSWYEIFYSSWV